MCVEKFLNKFLMRSCSKKVMWLWLVKYRTDQKCLCGIFLPFLLPI